MQTSNKKIIRLPSTLSFQFKGIYDFNRTLSIFDWNIKNSKVEIDFRQCRRANYQALALVMLYVWQLKSQGCYINFRFGYYNGRPAGASQMWHLMGARGWSQVVRLANENFTGHKFKPLHAIRNHVDFNIALSTVETYTEGFDVEYEKTLRYVISELLYNTLEHGRADYVFQESNLRLPSIIQFTWYRSRNELHFIIADLGIGIKKHLEQTYSTFPDHVSAIAQAIRPNVSGTFGVSNPYKSKNNAGVGLFISSNIIGKMKADMHIISGNGLVHISSNDTTRTELTSLWPGTFVHVEVSLGTDPSFNLHKLMAEFREEAGKEISKATAKEESKIFLFNVWNYFGNYAEDKQAAITQRDKRIIPEINKGKTVRLDFDKVISAPHSFLSALLATPIKKLDCNLSNE